MQINSACLHSMGEVKVNAIFQRWDSVRNFREIILAHLLLRCEIERGVIGGESTDEPLAQTIPEEGLVLFIAERWRHDVLRPFKVCLGRESVEQEILNKRFD